MSPIEFKIQIQLITEWIQDHLKQKTEADHNQAMEQIVRESQILSLTQAMKVRMRDIAKYIKEKIKEDIEIKVDHLLVTDTKMEGSQKTGIEVVHLIQTMTKGENKVNTVAEERKRKINDDNIFYFNGTW